MKLILEDNISLLDSETTPHQFLEAIADSGVQEDSFYVMDVGDVIQKFEIWQEKLPKVRPFYAVKCNDSPIVLKLLAALGTGFDCASKGEVEKVLNLGVSPDRIIFANPTKMVSHLKYAARRGVDLMTFDNMTELHKTAAAHPTARLVLRLRCDSIDTQCPLGMKFGCELADAGSLLKTAAALGLEVVGLSFHVGSGCREPQAYARAIKSAAQVASLAKSYSHNITLLDIGGGFPGDKGTSIDLIAEVVNKAIEEEFGDSVEVIAEPGRFFVASAYTLATAVHSVRETQDAPMYYINDGVYGSFNCLLYDHAIRPPRPLKKKGLGETRRSVVWGPTCDSLDLVSDDCQLPELKVGDWLYFTDMGAYTLPIASNFNGFPKPRVHHVISNKQWSVLKETVPICCKELPPLPTTAPTATAATACIKVVN